MTTQSVASEHGQSSSIRRGERSLRLATGLIILAYVVSHFINLAFGIRSVEAMQAASAYLITPWQTMPGLVAVYGSIFVHGLLGLMALHRRRHLRLPAGEAWQLALGLLIPLLLIAHAGTIRIGSSVYDMEFTFARVLHEFWVVSPGSALVRQMILLLIVWVHACIGLRSYLRARQWYHRVSGPLVSLATLVPALAIVGVVSAGLDVRDATRTDPAFAATMAAPTGQAAENVATLHRIVDGLAMLYLALVVGILGTRVVRHRLARRFKPIRITYPNERTITVPAGFSVLEASRWAGIPHTSVCGGRARCSTCRIRVGNNADMLAPPGAVELATLRRIGAAPNVRLACQTRPQVDIAVQPLVPALPRSPSGAHRFDAAVEGGRELPIVAMFIDMRGSTGLAAGRLPFDALFLFDRYIQTVTGAVRKNGGHVTSIAGDGLMSVFGFKGTAAAAARNALTAALDVWSGLESLNAELENELPRPLRIGIGIHAGDAVIGMVSTGDAQVLQFLGDTGNIAAKLEQRTKDLGGTVVVSAAVLDLVTPKAVDGGLRAVAIDGRDQPVNACVLQHRHELEQIISMTTASG